MVLVSKGRSAGELRLQKRDGRVGVASPDLRIGMQRTVHQGDRQLAALGRQSIRELRRLRVWHVAIRRSVRDVSMFS